MVNDTENSNNSYENVESVQAGVNRLTTLYKKRIELMKDEFERIKDNAQKESLKAKIEMLEFIIVDLQKLLK